MVNILLGDGRSVGAPLTAHPAVDMVSFTGGLATGQAIIHASAATVKRVAVELGGKNPNIVFADTDFETAVDYALTAVFLHSGQVCSAGARLIVEDSVHDDLVAEIGRRADMIRLGNGFDEGSESGPLVSAAHRAKIEDFVASALADGARLVAGGRRPEDPELQKGYFYRPTLLADCTPGHAGDPRGDLRPDPHRRAVHRPRTRRSRWATTPSTAWPARSGRPTWAGRSGWPARCGTARCGSTTTTRTSPRRSGAG